MIQVRCRRIPKRTNCHLCDYNACTVSMQEAQQLAHHLKAPCYALSELKAENLYHTVKACPEPLC